MWHQNTLHWESLILGGPKQKVVMEGGGGGATV